MAPKKVNGVSSAKKLRRGASVHCGDAEYDLSLIRVTCCYLQETRIANVDPGVGSGYQKFRSGPAGTGRGRPKKPKPVVESVVEESDSGEIGDNYDFRGSSARARTGAKRHRMEYTAKTKEENKKGIQPWEAAFLREFLDDYHDPRVTGWTPRDCLCHAESVRLSVTGVGFPSDGARAVWWSKFRRKVGLRVMKGRHPSLQTAPTLWQKVKSNWDEFDKLMDQIEHERSKELVPSPLVMVNTDETYCLSHVAQSVVAPAGSWLKRCTPAMESSKAGVSLLVWQSSTPHFIPPPTILTGQDRGPKVGCKQRMVGIMKDIVPGSTCYLNGNREKGVHWMTQDMWAEVMRRLIQIKKKLGKFYLIVIYDKASPHQDMSADLKAELAATHIYPLMLAGSTTSLQQILDMDGLLSKFKSEVRNLEAVPGNDWACTHPDFWLAYRSIVGCDRYSRIEPFRRVGFTPGCHRARRVGGDGYALHSVLTSLREEAIQYNEAVAHVARTEGLEAVMPVDHASVGTANVSAQTRYLLRSSEHARGVVADICSQVL
jgi:hypothetical protein